MNKNKVVLNLIGLFIVTLTIYGSYLIWKDIAYDNGLLSDWIGLYLIIAFGLSFMLLFWNLFNKDKRFNKKQSLVILLIAPLTTLSFSAIVVVFDSVYLRDGIYLTIFIILLLLFKNSKFNTMYALIGTLSVMTLFGWFLFGVLIIVDPYKIISSEVIVGYLLSFLTFILFLILWLRRIRKEFGLKTLFGLVILGPIYISIGLMGGKYIFMILFLALFALHLKQHNKATVAQQI